MTSEDSSSPSNGEDDSSEDSEKKIKQFNANITDLSGSLVKYMEMQENLDNFVKSMSPNYLKFMNINGELEKAMVDMNTTLERIDTSAIQRYLELNEQVANTIQKTQISSIQNLYVNLAAVSKLEEQSEVTHDDTVETVSKAKEAEITYLDLLAKYIANSDEIFSEENKESARRILSEESREKKREYLADIITSCSENAKMAIQLVTKAIFMMVLFPMLVFGGEDNSDKE